ncbi:MAG: hypothetical protein LBL62_04840 [Planctomycetaceae bacterium]|nr:hypothetical protein [Planctomycetaceae bacterium]
MNATLLANSEGIAHLMKYYQLFYYSGGKHLIRQNQQNSDVNVCFADFFTDGA